MATLHGRGALQMSSSEVPTPAIIVHRTFLISGCCTYKSQIRAAYLIVALCLAIDILPSDSIRSQSDVKQTANASTHTSRHIVERIDGMIARRGSQAEPRTLWTIISLRRDLRYMHAEDATGKA